MIDEALILTMERQIIAGKSMFIKKEKQYLAQFVWTNILYFWGVLHLPHGSRFSTKYEIFNQFQILLDTFLTTSVFPYIGMHKSQN